MLAAFEDNDQHEICWNILSFLCPFILNQIAYLTSKYTNLRKIHDCCQMEDLKLKQKWVLFKRYWFQNCTTIAIYMHNRHS